MKLVCQVFKEITDNVPAPPNQGLEASVRISRPPTETCKSTIHLHCALYAIWGHAGMRVGVTYGSSLALGHASIPCNTDAQSSVIRSGSLLMPHITLTSPALFLYLPTSTPTRRRRAQHIHAACDSMYLLHLIAHALCYMYTFDMQLM